METKALIDSTWIMLCAFLVFFMQAGFLCLEAGLTRSKNNINVTAKNLVDFFTGTLFFYLIGYGLMFGETSFMGYWGTSKFIPHFDSLFEHAFFFFQLMFATTAITIISGAVAERIRFKSYVVTALLVAILIYPVFGHWAWAGLETGHLTGWLGERGFVDFAGGTVVHSIGGWVALALLLVLGPRAGRFGKDGSVNKIEGANLPLAGLGVLLLLFGWFGFNGGSLFTLNNQVVVIIVNTILGGCGGLAAVLIFSTFRESSISVYNIFNGILVGLVAGTPSAHATSHLSAIIIGLIAGMLMLISSKILIRLKIDDAVEAIPVHLVGGAWGTIAVAFLADYSLLGTGLSFQEQFAIQTLGVTVAGIWGFVPTFAIFYVVNRISPLRVSLDEERLGLNVAEHNASTELISFLSLLEYQSRSGDTSLRAPVEPFTEVGQIAGLYNGVMERLDDKQGQLSTVLGNAPLALFSADIFGNITLIEGRFFEQLNIRSNQSLYQLFRKDELSKQNVLYVYDGQARDWVANLGGYHVYFRCQPVKDSYGKISGLTGVASDITQQRESDLEREKFIDMLSTSAQISEQITTILDTDDLIETILPLLKKKYNLYHAAVLMLDESSQTLKFAFGSDERSRKLSEQRESISLSHPSSLIARAARRKRVVVSNDVLSEPNYLPHPFLTATKSELAIPLMVHNQLIGVLDIQENQINRFSDSDVNLFTSISRQIAIAINNANLFDKFQKSEANLKTALARAVQSDKAKDEFLARVSHELRTPLGVILGYAEMLQDEIYGVISGEQSERLTDIINSSTHLTSMVNQLLDSAKLESGTIEPALTEFNLPELVQSIYQQMDALAQKKALNFQLNVHPNIKEIIIGDPILVKQMLINLIGNSIKFTETGSVQLEVCSRDDGYFSLIVRDTGIGIPEKFQKRIFEPFLQVDGSITRAHNGTGLGLAITKRMTDLLGGTIDLVSVENRGSQFTITLPMWPAEKLMEDQEIIKNKQKVPVPKLEPVI